MMAYILRTEVKAVFCAACLHDTVLFLECLVRYFMCTSTGVWSYSKWSARKSCMLKSATIFQGPLSIGFVLPAGVCGPQERSPELLCQCHVAMPLHSS